MAVRKGSGPFCATRLAETKNRKQQREETTRTLNFMIHLLMTNEEIEILSGNSCQRIQRRLIPGCQGQSCAILSSGALSVSLIFQQGAKQVVGLEGRRVLSKIISGKIAADHLDCAGIVASRLQQRRSRIKERRVVFALRAGRFVQG